MKDDLFDDAPEREEAAPAAEAAKPDAAAAAAASAADARLERLERSFGTLVEKLDRLAEQPAGDPAPPAPAAPPSSITEQVEQFAQNPKGWVGEVAREAVEEAIRTSVSPLAMQTLSVASQQLLGTHAAAVDAKFGEGTWDELFRPQLEKDLGRLRENPNTATAAADPTTVQALVRRLYGEHFDGLVERRTAHQKNQESQKEAGMQEILSHLPTGGVPRLRARGPDDALPDGVEQFIREVDKATGTTTDRKRFAQVYATGQETGRSHRTDVVEYLKSIGADPEVIKEHGGQPGGQR